MSKETFNFQTEARKLLQLMINSLYSNKEVFLRELISNASDAVDKLRFELLSKPEVIEGDPDFKISIDFDEEAHTLMVADNGIGMSRDEVIDNLGTIAKSGTEEFFEQLTGDQKSDANLIGQFGVGFYSVFMVSDKVEVVSCRAGSTTGVRWTSKGEDEFTIEDCKAERGTKITLSLKQDAHEYANGYRLRSIVHRYADHVSIPVEMPKEGDEEGRETVNEATALWARSRSEISDDEYKEFYKHISHDFEEPLVWSHNRVEGRLEYTSLLYVPKRAPFDLWNYEAARGLKLYIQRVFIMDDAEVFLPLYLRFVKGVVDAEDLPLNISREALQENQQVASLRNALTKRVLDTLEKLATEDTDSYNQFWDTFGQVLKEGASSDFTNRDALLKLYRFSSTHDNTAVQRTSLKDYLERVKDDQDKIYYLVAEAHASALESPHLEIFRKKKMEVLLLSDRVDPWFVAYLQKYEDKEWQDISRGDLDLKTDEEQVETPEDEPLIKRILEVLKEKVEDVRSSSRLTDSPACLVLPKDGMNRQLQRMMEMAGQRMPLSKPSLEVNLDHPLVRHLSKEQDDERFSNIANIIFDQAALADGLDQVEPGVYVRRINRLLTELIE